jgi:hypothetical protein
MEFTEINCKNWTRLTSFRIGSVRKIFVSNHVNEVHSEYCIVNVTYI